METYQENPYPKTKYLPFFYRYILRIAYKLQIPYSVCVYIYIYIKPVTLFVIFLLQDSELNRFVGNRHLF
jgi:hypothetical protein